MSRYFVTVKILRVHFIYCIHFNMKTSAESAVQKIAFIEFQWPLDVKINQNKLIGAANV